MPEKITTTLKRGFRRSVATAMPAVLLAAGLAGCATAPPKTDTAAFQAFQQVNDPLEPTNRFFYKVNNGLDNYVMKPVAKGYVAITTQGIRNHVENFVTNFGEPARWVNFMAEGMPTNAGTSFMRFMINSTVGIGGIFDPATALGYKETDTDAGLTLAIWGVPPGPYLYLPFLGPSGARDFVNVPAQYYAVPVAVVPSSIGLRVFSYTETTLRLVNTRAEFLGPIDQVKATALDPYATFRSLYRQSRTSDIQQIFISEGRTPPAWTETQY